MSNLEELHEEDLKSDSDDNAPNIINGINMDFREELIEAYNNSARIAELSENMRESMSVTPLDKYTHFIACDGKEFIDEKECVEYSLNLESETL